MGMDSSHGRQHEWMKRRTGAVKPGQVGVWMDVAGCADAPFTVCVDANVTRNWAEMGPTERRTDEETNPRPFVSARWALFSTHLDDNERGG